MMMMMLTMMLTMMLKMMFLFLFFSFLFFFCNFLIYLVWMHGVMNEDESRAECCFSARHTTHTRHMNWHD